MWKVTWRNLVARKVRLLLSAFAIILGVAFVAGTLIFTNAMGGAFDNIIEGSTAAVEVTPKGAGDFDSSQDNRTLPASLVTKLEGLPEVDQAWASDSLQTVFVIGKDGKVVESMAGFAGPDDKLENALKKAGVSTVTAPSGIGPPEH